MAPPQERAEVNSPGSVQIVQQTACKPADCAAKCLQTCRLCSKLPANCQVPGLLSSCHSLIDCRWGKREIHFKLPKEAEPVLSRYLECRNLLAQADNPCLLVTPTGLVYELSNYNQRFGEILCTWQAPARFSPQVRHAHSIAKHTCPATEPIACACSACATYSWTSAAPPPLPLALPPRVQP